MHASTDDKAARIISRRWVPGTEIVVTVKHLPAESILALLGMIGRASDLWEVVSQSRTGFLSTTVESEREAFTVANAMFDNARKRAKVATS